MRLLSWEKVGETSPVSSKSESKSNLSPILMASKNETAQAMKMLERMQAKMDVSDKKVELTANTLQTFIKDAPIEDGEGPQNK